MRVEYEDAVAGTFDLIENIYYGTGWRAAKHSDRSVPLDGQLEHERTQYYDTDWRLVQEMIVDDSAVNPDPGRVAEYHYGLRGLNDIVMRRESTDVSNDSPHMTFERTRYYCTDSQFSVRVVLDGSGTVIERVSYDAYGAARHHRFADIEPDDGTGQQHGAVNTFDMLALLGAWGQFGQGDLNRDGTVNVFDDNMLLGGWGPALPAGDLSSAAEDNIFGYTGGVFEPELQIYSFRNRWYDPELGRFVQRDPAGYVDGLNLYLYGLGNPLAFMDPLGLFGLFGDCVDWVLGTGGGADIEEQKARRHLKEQGQLGPGEMTEEERLALEAAKAEVAEEYGEYRDAVHAEGAEGFAEGAYDGAVGASAAVVDEATLGLGGDYVVDALAIDSEYANMGRSVMEGGIMAMEVVATGGGTVVARQAGKRAVREVAQQAGERTARSGGRLGSNATRRHVTEVADTLESRGWKVTHGGGRPGLKEEYIRGAGPGTRGSAYPDITATKNGRTLRVNTVDTLSDGVAPTAREMRNAQKIRNLRPDDHLITVPKPKP